MLGSLSRCKSTLYLLFSSQILMKLVGLLRPTQQKKNCLQEQGFYRLLVCNNYCQGVCGLFWFLEKWICLLLPRCARRGCLFFGTDGVCMILTCKNSYWFLLVISSRYHNIIFLWAYMWLSVTYGF